MVKVALNLVVIYVVAVVILAVVYAKTSPVIFQKNKEEKEAALKRMMPDAEAIVKEGDWAPQHKHAEYYAAKSGGETQGYVVETYGKGYSSYINMLVAVDTDFVVRKIAVLHHGETPGLGDEIETAWFRDQYEGKTLDKLVVVKGETEDKIQAITGATISTRAVTNGVRDGVGQLITKYGPDAVGMAGMGHGAAEPAAETH